MPPASLEHKFCVVCHVPAERWSDNLLPVCHRHLDGTAKHEDWEMSGGFMGAGPIAAYRASLPPKDGA